MNTEQTAALLALLEKLCWETQYELHTEDRPFTMDPPKTTIRASHDECKLCGVPHVYPHKATCPVVTLAAAFGQSIQNPDADPDLGEYKPEPPAAIIFNGLKWSHADAAALAVRSARAPLFASAEMDLDDPFADN